MNKAIENLLNAQKHALSMRPKVGGFPVFAEALREAGIEKNIWSLPSCQSLYLTKYGDVVQQGTPLLDQTAEIPPFDEAALVRALRLDQAGESTFPQFLKSSWEAGVIGYTVDFEQRICTYYGAHGEHYVEKYPTVTLSAP